MLRWRSTARPRSICSGSYRSGVRFASKQSYRLACLTFCWFHLALQDMDASQVKLAEQALALQQLVQDLKVAQIEAESASILKTHFLVRHCLNPKGSEDSLRVL